MPRPRSPGDYPKEFQEVFRKATLEGQVSVPFDTYRKAWNFRARLYRYRVDVRKALEEDGMEGPLRHRLSLQHEFMEKLELSIEHTDSGAVLHIQDPYATDDALRRVRSVIEDE